LDQEEEAKLEAIFDSYCKTVIRNAGRNIRKRYMRLLNNEVLVDFSSGGFLDETTINDDFPSDILYIEFKEKYYPVKSILLHERLSQLPSTQLEILILKYWCGQTDQQIADAIGISARTVRNRRSRALNTLRARWKGD
jgi:RNA polymerase sigma factor (sigma-70 family)